MHSLHYPEAGGPPAHLTNVVSISSPLIVPSHPTSLNLLWCQTPHAVTLIPDFSHFTETHICDLSVSPALFDCYASDNLLHGWILMMVMMIQTSCLNLFLLFPVMSFWQSEAPLIPSICSSKRSCVPGCLSNTVPILVQFILTVHALRPSLFQSSPSHNKYNKNPIQFSKALQTSNAAHFTNPRKTLRNRKRNIIINYLIHF